MRLTVKTVSLLAVLLVTASVSAAPPPGVAKVTRTAELLSLAQQLRDRDREARRDASALARQLRIPLRRDLPDGRVLELVRLNKDSGPVFYTTYNVDAADTVSTDDVWPGGSAGLLLTGSGMRLGEWDGGSVLAEHPDLYPRVNQVDGATTLSNHATHVAGTLIGAGTAQRPEARGMAYEALLDAYDWLSDTAEMAAAAADGLVLSNHSYGIAAGWIYIGGAGADEWWWIGGSGDEDANFGYYDAETALWDEVAYYAPYYLIVKAAGNDRWDVGPSSGQQYTVVDQNGDFVEFSNQPRDADCAPLGYDCMPTVSGAKNILTIGSVDDVPGGYLPLVGPLGVQVSSFSGWGPTDDGRIKPDVMGNGWLLLSTYGQDPYFAAALGTSMAAPNVTGSLALLQQHYENVNGTGQFMRAATLKGLAIHTADETGGAAGPDYQYGWGLLNTRKAAGMIAAAGSNSQQIIEGTLQPGTTNTVSIEVADSEAVLKVTLVWTDPPGTPAAPPVLDASQSMLVNDLDLRVVGDSETYFPWVLDPNNPGNPATTGDNWRDNVEQVQASVTAGTYNIAVSHKPTLSGSQPQNYALLISILPPPPVAAGYAIDEDFSTGLPAGWTLEKNSGGRDWQILDPIPGNEKFDNRTGGSGRFAMLDNYVDGSFAWTRSSLVSHTVDLSASNAATLTFNSYFIYDTVETLNVDVSNNGGSNWVNVWSRQGFGASGLPTTESVDLTSVAAGYGNVKIRFRFESGYIGPDGYHWQVDNVRLQRYGGAEPPEPPPPNGDLPAQVSDPVPANGADEQSVDATLSWSSGQFASSYNVYLGTSAVLDSGDFRSSQSATTFDPGTLAANTTFYWRVDSVNTDGTTEGVTWSFATGAAPPPPPEPDPIFMHVGDLDADRAEAGRNKWNAIVDVRVHDASEQAVAGVTVDGSWSAGASGGGSCTTGATGVCSIEKTSIKGNVSSAVFTVQALTHPDGHEHDTLADHDGDGDSDGVTITVQRVPDSGPTNSPPVVSITSPAPGASFDSSASISFTGSAQDDEDGPLSSMINWSSSLDGDIGSGGTISAVLSDGTHSVTATVTDSGGEAAADSVSVTVGTITGVVAHVGSVAGSAEPGARNRWTATATITVHHAAHGNPGAGITVDGTWSDGAKGGASCVTDGTGQCSVSKSSLRSSSVRFTVNSLSGTDVSYDSGGNDQDPSEIINQP